MPKSIMVACRLPNGITLEHPLNPNHKVTLDGLNKVRMIGAPHAITEVDADFWGVWEAANADFTPYKNGSIFAAGTARDIEAMSRDIVTKTGLEPMPQDAYGLTPANEKRPV